ncbi:MAG: hypothetical protein RMJ14_04625 [Nitrososphaerota archaeon]|nr:hypothetical protein [Aigarchaeota archaeon]MDW8076903.1 hypothetical protein [Nitrososphaerota archaeon]
MASVLKRRETFDFTSSGIAVYSAATLHRIKTERLLASDEVPVVKQKQEYFIPPPIFPPLKGEFVTTTIMELISALKHVLSESPPQRKQNNDDEQQLNIEDFIIKIEEKLEEFYNFIKEVLEIKGIITLDEIMSGVNRLEAVRRFILLLFIASRGMITIIEDDNGKILISMGGIHG